MALFGSDLEHGSAVVKGTGQGRLIMVHALPHLFFDEHSRSENPPYHPKKLDLHANWASIVYLANIYGARTKIRNFIENTINRWLMTMITSLTHWERAEGRSPIIDESNLASQFQFFFSSIIHWCVFSCCSSELRLSLFSRVFISPLWWVSSTDRVFAKMLLVCIEIGEIGLQILKQ